MKALAGAKIFFSKIFLTLGVKESTQKNGLIWAIAYYGGFAVMWMTFLLIPIAIIITKAALGDLFLIGSFLKIACRPWNLILLSFIGGGLFVLSRSLKVFPEGIRIREIVLDKTSRTLPGGKFQLFHPFSRLQGYFVGKHVIDSDDPKHMTNARVLDKEGFAWDVDLVFDFKAQDITRAAGTRYESDVDQLSLGQKKADSQKKESNGLTMEDLSGFDRSRIERMQFVKEVSAAIQNQVGIYFKGLSTDDVQSSDSKQKLAIRLNKEVDKFYRKIGRKILPDKEQPFLLKVSVNQILPTSETEEALGSIAKVERMKTKGLIDKDDAAEIFKRQALKGSGGVILGGGSSKKK